MRTPRHMKPSDRLSWLTKILPSQPLTADELRANAEREGPEAQNNLGVLFASCEEPHHNDTAAVECLRSAADQGHALAQYNLALLYEHGRGVPKNLAEARGWLIKAAARGDAGAQFHLGMAWHRESFRPGNLAVDACKIEALKWLLLAAAQDYHNAETSCGSLILVMTHEQLAESNRRVAAFKEVIDADRSDPKAADETQRQRNDYQSVQKTSQ
jgi:TPR repeat protein